MVVHSSFSSLPPADLRARCVYHRPCRAKRASGDLSLYVVLLAAVHREGSNYGVPIIVIVLAKGRMAT